VSRSIGPDASAFVIDHGSDDGVVVGTPAISGDGIMVGKVVAVTASSASVRVISDRNSATAVTLLNGTRTIGVAQGMSGALLSLEFIPQDERVSVNDIVVTSGLETSVPSGLLIGIVNSVETNPNAPFQQAVIEPLADVRRMSVVTVILPEPTL
jgi:rod shape-determining protein MreC